MPYEFSSIAEAADEIRDFVATNPQAIPSHVMPRVHGFTRTGSSPVDLLVTFVRAIYSNRDDKVVTPQALEIAAAAADLVDMNGFHGRIEGNAGRIAQALRRDAGVPAPRGRGWPAKTSDPEPSADFLPQEMAEDSSTGDAAPVEKPNASAGADGTAPATAPAPRRRTSSKAK